MLHTPGPWTLGKAHGTARNHAVCSGPQVIAKVVGFGYPVGEGWSQESEDNARLIAAAPELLAALKAICEYPTESEESRLFAARPHLSALFTQARSAIAKAERSLATA